MSPCSSCFLSYCRALAELVKHKPKATAEQLKTVMDDFAQFLDTCCKAADKDTCFSTEVRNVFAF
jgi:serum albumin